MRAAHSRRAAFAGALLPLLVAPSAVATPDSEALTDRLLFTEPLVAFVEVRGSGDRPVELDWSSDGCTGVPDRPLGHDFTKACWRHDFGYRNYKAQSRFTEEARLRIDQRFRADMYGLCGGRALCEFAAEVYYKGVRELGG